MIPHTHTVLDTADPDELSAFLAAKHLRLTSVGQRDARRLSRVAVWRATDSYVSELSYGADVDISMPGGAGDYTVSLPVAGAMRLDSKGDGVTCAGARGGITSPAADTRLSIPAGSSRVSLMLSRRLIEGELERLSCHHVQGAVTFDCALDLTGRPDRILSETLRMLTAGIPDGENPLDDPCRRRHFEATVAGALLLYHPHSHAALLGAPACGAISRDVRRVIDYIHAALDQPITLGDLVAVAGVPARTLNAHFRAATGFPPMTYLRRERLRAVRAALLGDPGARVTTLAFAYGFTHLGRFASEYRRMFGEAPSETRASRRP
ncbi:AraC family transcriptional regulator [Ovoidimarina sediminis]|uniref:AraC family transcriptional regulator n=1 Tax=Ovoidimarina sediminis TaxID=3079856 RepID=UPI00290B3834|nr:helix-turn-helix transcriptional regulator [Rhodophyticola sp. MJ-SS7]MDU8941978.1 helix-turn-helix transcriptional regulator [Rhodophyticola sp. MJ-SS7]